MIDTHFHLEAAKDPAAIATKIDSSRVMTVAVTSLPSIYARMSIHVGRYRFIRLALGLHPLLAAQHADETSQFRDLVSKTSYVGEVGLDFSREGSKSQEVQVAVFESVLEAVAGRRKFITIHSRGAESEVLRLLTEKGIGPTVFHWFTGSNEMIDEVVRAGHYCSVNPAMIRSPKGRRLINRIPPDRILTETDGPHIVVDGRAAMPGDVKIVLQYLASAMGMPPDAVDSKINVNFTNLLQRTVIGSA